MLTRHEKYSENPKNSRKITRDTLGYEKSKKYLELMKKDLKPSNT
jgi:hypothetical protein